MLAYIRENELIKAVIPGPNTKVFGNIRRLTCPKVSGLNVLISIFVMTVWPRQPLFSECYEGEMDFPPPISSTK